jgi:Xaa-Pro aminopeptidase
MLYNEARAQELLRTYGVDAIVAASRIGVDYVTGHRSTFESTFLGYHIAPGGHGRLVHRSFGVAPASGERILVVSAPIAATTVPDGDGGLEPYGGGGFDPAAAEAMVDEEFRGLARQLARGSSDVDHLGALAAALRRSVPAGGRVAIEADGLLPGELETLRGLVPELEVGDGSVLLRLIRMVKTDDEIERSRRAAEIAEVALQASIDVAAEGVTLAEMAQVFRAHAAAEGADLEHYAIDPFGLGIATISGYRVRPRDILLLDVGCLYRSVISDTCVTLALAPLEGEAAERYGLVRDALEAGAAAMAVGTKVGDVHRAMRAVVDGTLAETSAPQGHGLGLEPKELPFIAADRGLRLKDDCVDLDANQTLEPDMVLNLEVPLDVPGQYAVHVERTFVLDGDGLRGITPQERGSEVIPAGAGA